MPTLLKNLSLKWLHASCEKVQKLELSFSWPLALQALKHAVDHSIYASGVFKGFRHVNESLLD